MLTWAMKKVFGTSHERNIRRMRPRVEAINALETRMAALSDAELRAKTVEFRQKLANGAKLDDLLVEAFAVCREASKRVLRMRHYDVQLIGGMVLHSGSIAEMRTGEGKTLVATLPVYLNALEGKGVHVVTVNDYLATRDAEWMGRLYKWLGLSIGTIVNQQSDADKRHAYQADIAYGQNNEFGFDYLRDNMKFSALDYAQRPLNFAIVDEVDSILIDEARTPLIISGAGEKSSDKYHTLNEIIPRMKLDAHYVVDEKGHTVTLTDEGVEVAQKLLGIANLYDPVHLQTLHILNQCLRAHTLYKRDVHYMVSDDGKILIIDEFTGRVLPGRRWSDGLHQAVEAKENVRVQEENRTMATITFQNLFRLYKKLAGMTGTADTEAGEFHGTYKLDVTIIPTNKPIERVDYEDVVYKTEREKFTAVIKELMEYHERGQPVLVGTTSVEKSAAIAKILQRRNVPHNVLNAKHHAKEAEVIAQAGRKKAITVSTNMAGRGTDIILGGNAEMMAKIAFKEQNRLPDAEPEAFNALVDEYEAECAKERAEVRELGGLHILGTERHESRRIDNQLRGRAGRQGDPGSSRFYLSLEDDLMRIFAGDKVKNLMDRMGMPDDEPIEHPWVTKSVQNAQQKVEERNFDIRKNLLEYDDVMSAQRKTVYALRQQLLQGRYTPDELDDDGRPTGEAKKIEPRKEIADEVLSGVTQIIGMFAKRPVRPEGDAKLVARAQLEGAELVELEQLQREVYQYWGLVLDIKNRETDALGVYDELTSLVPLALTEQRERILDLADRIIGAMVEESCPPNRTPDDWDWGGVREGMKEHFGVALGDEIEELGDQELLARKLYDAAFVVLDAKQKELGIELMCRVFRHVYLEEIDHAWVDHLQNMDHLRDGIGLRGYGQKDPKQEYKREGYDLFRAMLYTIAEKSMSLILRLRIEKEVKEEEFQHKETASELEYQSSETASEPKKQKPVKRAAKTGRNDPCTCGSGKKFKSCCGR